MLFLIFTQNDTVFYFIENQLLMESIYLKHYDSLWKLFYYFICTRHHLFYYVSFRSCETFLELFKAEWLCSIYLKIWIFINKRWNVECGLFLWGFVAKDWESDCNHHSEDNFLEQMALYLCWFCSSPSFLAFSLPWHHAIFNSANYVQRAVANLIF